MRAGGKTIATMNVVSNQFGVIAPTVIQTLEASDRIRERSRGRLRNFVQWDRDPLHVTVANVPVASQMRIYVGERVHVDSRRSESRRIGSEPAELSIEVRDCANRESRRVHMREVVRPPAHLAGHGSSSVRRRAKSAESRRSICRLSVLSAALSLS